MIIDVVKTKRFENSYDCMIDGKLTGFGSTPAMAIGVAIMTCYYREALTECNLELPAEYRIDHKLGVEQ